MFKKSRKERDELRRITVDSYKKALKEYNSAKPEDENYNDVCHNFNDIQDKVLEMAQEDKKLKWDIVKFIIGTIVGCGQVAVTFLVTLVGMDWEAANSMRSRFAPGVIQMLPKSWRMPTER